MKLVLNTIIAAVLSVTATNVIAKDFETDDPKIEMRYDSAKEVIRGLLSDPASAVFYYGHYSYRPGNPALCGQVNARNKFGGYAGPRTYIVIFDEAGKIVGGGILPEKMPRDHRYFDVLENYNQIKASCLNTAYDRAFFKNDEPNYGAK